MSGCFVCVCYFMGIESQPVTIRLLLYYLCLSVSLTISFFSSPPPFLSLLLCLFLSLSLSLSCSLSFSLSPSFYFLVVLYFPPSLCLYRSFPLCAFLCPIRSRSVSLLVSLLVCVCVYVRWNLLITMSVSVRRFCHACLQHACLLYVCMFVCMHVCMFACMHVCMYGCTQVCMHVHMS